jgi:tRNA G18 (ribose-2'-O)-methylase SpoU
LDLVQTLRAEGKWLVALEGGERTTSIFREWVLRDRPTVLVVGNEVAGVDPGILEICDEVVSIPMLGMKESLNAAVAFGIAIYTLRYRSLHRESG